MSIFFKNSIIGLTSFSIFTVSLFVISQQLAYKNECPVSIEERSVRGESLSGIVESGEKVKIFAGFYECNDPKRGDIVAFKYAGYSNLVAKVVKGLPGDEFRLERNGEHWNLLINNYIVRNSRALPHVFGESEYKILHMYERDYKKIIPDNSYLLLGNLTSGALDGSVFGLVDRKDIVGKVVK